MGYWDGKIIIFKTVSMIGEKNTILDRSGLTLSDAAEIETRLFQNKEGL